MCGVEQWLLVMVKMHNQLLASSCESEKRSNIVVYFSSVLLLQIWLCYCCLVYILSLSVIQCPQLNAPANGNVQMIAPPGIRATPQDYGAVARYTCNSGYYLDGNQIRNCVGDGTSIAGNWDGSQPSCIGK